MTTPANRFFDNPFAVPIGSSARSPSVTNTFEDIEAGFTAVQEELDRLRFVRQFPDLLDVPRTYAGAAKRVVRVKPGMNGLEFVQLGLIDIYTASGASNNLDAQWTGGVVFVDHSADTALNVRAEATHAVPVGAVIGVNQAGAGQVVITPAVGVTVRSTDGLMRTRTQHAEVALIYLGSDQWLLTGERNAAALSYASTTTNNIFNGQQSMPFVDLPFATTMTIDANVGNNRRVTMTGNGTLANPTNMASGVVINVRIRQDGTGGRTLSYGSKWKWPGGTPPALSTAANSVDMICAMYEPQLDILMCNMLKGFA